MPGCFEDCIVDVGVATLKPYRRVSSIPVKFDGKIVPDLECEETLTPQQEIDGLDEAVVDFRKKVDKLVAKIKCDEPCPKCERKLRTNAAGQEEVVTDIVKVQNVRVVNPFYRIGRCNYTVRGIVDVKFSIIRGACVPSEIIREVVLIPPKETGRKPVPKRPKKKKF